MVSPQNPWKSGSQMTPDHHRLMMARLAVEEEDGIVASDYELNLPTPSYTYKTLRCLRHDFPSDTFVLLVGGDNWAAFDKWAEYREILAHHTIAVYPRPGSPVVTPHALRDMAGDHVILDAQQMDISSSMIRGNIARGNDVAGLLPEALSVNLQHGRYLVSFRRRQSWRGGSSSRLRRACSRAPRTSSPSFSLLRDLLLPPSVCSRCRR